MYHNTANKMSLQVKEVIISHFPHLKKKGLSFYITLRCIMESQLLYCTENVVYFVNQENYPIDNLHAKSHIVAGCLRVEENQVRGIKSRKGEN